MRIVACIAALLAIAGIFLPGWQDDTALLFAGLQIPGGWEILLLAGAMLSLIGGLAWKKKGMPGEWISTFGALGMLATLLFLLRLCFREPAYYSGEIRAPFSAENSVGWLLALLASGTALAAGLLIYRKENRFSIRQTPTAHFIARQVAFSRSGKNSGGSLSRFIIRISVVATVISVAVMIITLSLANGFQETVSQKVFSFLGHLRIQEKQPDKSIISEESVIQGDDKLVDAVRRHPKVESIHPFATRYVLLKTKEDMEGVMLKGVDRQFDFDRFARFLTEGRMPDFSDSVFSRDIILSDFTARQMRLKRNDRVLIYFVRPGSNEDGSGSLPDIRPYRLTICGIYKTGIEEYDRTFALGDIRLLQRQNIRGPGDTQHLSEVGGYEVFLKDYRNIDKVAAEIYEWEEFPLTWDTVSVKAVSPNIFDWLNMQDVTRNVLIAFMVIVAVINLITCLIILVLERVRMIGVLKALGATDRTVQFIFLRYTLYITVLGIVIGTAIALALLYLQQATGFIRLPEDAYYVNKAAVKIVWWQVGLIGLGTLLICFLVLMIPSYLARKVRPVSAIQFR